MHERGGRDGSDSLNLDNAFTALLDALGTLEKIMRTPIPLSYSRHTSRVFLLVVL
jgi:predicted membrane chloride channel (bestrophin family)